MTKPVRTANVDPLAPLPGECQLEENDQEFRHGSMNAPTSALVASRPERLRLVGQRRQILTMMHQRLMFGLLVYAGVVALIVLRILYLAAFGDHAGAKRGLTALVPERGDIIDRDGQPLARTIDAWTIGLWPRKVIGDKLEIARKLAQLMPERDEATYFAMLRSSKSFYYLRRRAAPGLVEAVNAIGEPGIALEREPDRLYPQTSLAAHVIGYTDVDGKGNAGIEWALNDQLADPAMRGQPLQLSISSRVQQALEHELLAAMTKILRDRRCGRDPGHPHRRSPRDDLAAAAQPECGRAGLARGALQPGDARRLRAWFDLQAVHGRDGDGCGHHQELRQDVSVSERRSTFSAARSHDTHPFNRACSVAEIMKESSNIGTAQIAAQLGSANASASSCDKMGFLEPVRYRASRARPAFDCRATTGVRLDTMTVGYGHSLAVSSASPRERAMRPCSTAASIARRPF